MKKRLTSLNGAITFNALALLTFLGRAFMDWRYEFPMDDPMGNWAVPGALIYMGLIGIWLWGLLAAGRGSRRGLLTCLISVLLLNIAFSLATYIFFCPPWTGCEVWPNGWTWNWLNFISGITAIVVLAFHLRHKDVTD